MKKKAIIIGAGPAGLTAAWELLIKTDIVPVILEKSGDIGGISKTVNYKGNRMDIGGHRFFSKSDRVMEWWLSILPLEDSGSEAFTLRYHNATRTVNPGQFATAGDTGSEQRMLVRSRLSRIYYLRKFFVYPISLSVDTVLQTRVCQDGPNRVFLPEGPVAAAGGALAGRFFYQPLRQ